MTRRVSSVSPVTEGELSRAAVDDAMTRIASRVALTPLSRSDQFGVLLKCEHLQVGGSFKFRGAANAVSAIGPERIVTASSGNHAISLALVAPHGVPVTAVMQRSAPLHKRRLAAAVGVEIMLCHGDHQARDEMARTVAEQRGADLIPSSDHVAVMAGQGTVLDEIMRQDPTVEVVFVPLGGGGLAAGAIVAARRYPHVRVIGVQPTGADAAARSRSAGRRVQIAGTDTICDGVRHREVSRLAWDVIAGGIADIVTVTDVDVVRSQRRLRADGYIVEPTGALALAGALRHPQARTAVVLSGGNGPGIATSTWTQRAVSHGPGRAVLGV